MLQFAFTRMHLESHVSDDSPMRRCVYVFSISPHKSVDIPPSLNNLPNVVFVEEPPLQICPGRP